jgi:hypothetical protein
MADDIVWDDEPEIVWDDEGKPGMGDLRKAEGRDQIIAKGQNVPVSMLTGDPETDRRIAESVYNSGGARALTKSDALHAGAIAGGVALAGVGGLPAAMASGALISGGQSENHPIKEGLKGAAIGGAVAKVLPPVVKWAGEKAVRYGRNALSGALSPLARRKELPEAAVREALDIGAIQPLGTVRGAAERLRQAADPLADDYADILKRLEAAGVEGPEAEALAQGFLNDAQAATQTSAMGRATGGPYAAALRESGESIASRALPVSGKGRLGLMQAEKMKRGLQSRASTDYHKEGPTSLAGAGRKETAARVRAAIEDAVEQQAAKAPAEAAAFEPVKAKLHRTLTALGAASEGAARQARRSPFGLHEAMGLASGIATGNPVHGVASAGGMNLLKERLPSTLAWTFDRTAKGLGGPAADSELAALIAAIRGGD